MGDPFRQAALAKTINVGYTVNFTYVRRGEASSCEFLAMIPADKLGVPPPVDRFRSIIARWYEVPVEITGIWPLDLRVTAEGEPLEFAINLTEATFE